MFGYKHSIKDWQTHSSAPSSLSSANCVSGSTANSNRNELPIPSLHSPVFALPVSAYTAVRFQDSPGITLHITHTLSIVPSPPVPLLPVLPQR